MPVRVAKSITLEDRHSLLEALRMEGYDRVMREKEQVLNKYFRQAKTRKQVERILWYYGQKSRSYNAYRLRSRSAAEEHTSHAVGSRLSSDTIFKWHHVLPRQESSIPAALAAAVRQIAQPAGDFTESEAQVLHLVSSLLDNGEMPDPLNSSSSLILASLIVDLDDEIDMGRSNSKSVMHHISQWFWKLLQEKERTIPADTREDTTDDSLAASLDPFNLSERLKLVERIEQIVEMSMIESAATCTREGTRAGSKSKCNCTIK